MVLWALTPFLYKISPYRHKIARLLPKVKLLANFWIQAEIQMSVTRIANKTQWALRDIIEHLQALQRKLDRGLNSELPDEVVLGIFAIRIATAERIARLALDGRYSSENRLPESQRVRDDDPGDEAEE